MAGGNSGHSFLRQILARFAVPWRDGVLPNTGQGEIDFNPPAPWGRDLVAVDEIPDQIDFNPPAPWGRDPALPSFGDKVRTYFNPPALWGAGPIIKNRLFPLKEFQSTRPVGGGTGRHYPVRCGRCISIHPPRGGRDLGTTQPQWSKYISIHPPRGGRDSNHAQNLLCTFLQLAQSRDCAGLAAGHNGRRSAVRTGQRVDFSVRTLRYFSDCFRFAPSDHQNALGLITCLDAKVLHLGLIMVSEVIKPQAVLLRIHQRT